MNPFDVTKAVDYSDNELFNNWVDFPSMSFDSFIKPTAEMPMIILGSKGSGKTHIMKHFSFNMQQFRSQNIFETIADEGYIGIYLRCSGLNGYRFSGRNESDETWEIVFSYYLDLWLTQLLLDCITTIFNVNTDMSNYQSSIIEEITKIFNSKEKLEFANYDELKAFINNEQRKIDYAINNISLTDGSIKNQIEILTNPGQLIFEVPYIITSIVKELSNLKVLFLLDEFENFSENQQRYFNTLIRERKNPVCFKIGAKRHGVKTKQTLSGGEDIKINSEYEIFDLDNIFRSNFNQYKEFLIKICLKRIENSNNSISGEITDHFEHSDYENDIKLISEKGKHLEKLTLKLTKLKIDNVSTIISNIRCEKNPLIERVNILLLYRGIKKKDDISRLSIKLRGFTEQFLKNKAVKEYDVILEKYKQDMIDALYRENSLKINAYCGFDNLAKISNGIPRHFLMIMKHIFRWNNFYNKNSYKDIITTDIQLLALKDTVLWFLEDANTSINNLNFKECIEKLCNYLRELRFSDLPPECSISTIDVDYSTLNKETKEIITFLEQYSYLIKLDSGRRDKNSNERNYTFQINGLLSSWWELSLSRRGIVKINSQNLKKILTEDGEEFKKFLKSEMIKYNVPFKNVENQPTLF